MDHNRPPNNRRDAPSLVYYRPAHGGLAAGAFNGYLLFADKAQEFWAKKSAVV